VNIHSWKKADLHFHLENMKISLHFRMTRNGISTIIVLLKLMMAPGICMGLCILILIRGTPRM
jgi:hypothetical protein